MTIEALDHVNIRTSDVVATSLFFADVLDMEIREAPGIPDRTMAAWLCDKEGRAVIHLGTSEVRYPWETESDVQDPGSGRIHHVAMRATGFDALIVRLEAQGRAYNVNHIAEFDLRQLFIYEPNGIQLELNFFGE